MASTGSIAPNFHEGTRSEYLAQYIFSAFGTSIPVPHPEDSGIDLYCTLGDRIGQRLRVQNYYLVQVKSEKKDICYPDEESVKWAVSHRYPLMICCIDKKSGNAEIYQTLPLTMCYAKRSIKSVTLKFDADTAHFANTPPSENVTLHIGPPILKFNITQLQDEQRVREATGILRFWIELDQENIESKGFGLTLFRVPETYATNRHLDFAKRFVGNFKDIYNDTQQETQFYDRFFRILAQVINQIAAKRDREAFRIVADFAGSLLSRLTLQDSWGVWILATAVNTGAKFLNDPRTITLKRDGKEVTPIADIEF